MEGNTDCNWRSYRGDFGSNSDSWGNFSFAFAWRGGRQPGIGRNTVAGVARNQPPFDGNGVEGSRTFGDLNDGHLCGIGGYFGWYKFSIFTALEMFQ